jgi:hypothetical protein
MTGMSMPERKAITMMAETRTTMIATERRAAVGEARRKVTVIRMAEIERESTA